MATLFNFKGPETAVPLNIPTDVQTIDGYVTRLRELLASPKTHVYVDTSFLVWLTALGGEARTEFISWIEKAVPDRFHVPVWSAHEYFHHHVHNLHGSKLTKVAGDLRRVADEAFGVLKPYLDSQITGDPRTPAAVVSEARTSLIEVKRLADAAARWNKDHYEANSGAVIGFINKFGLATGPLLDWMADIETLENARFEGRIPPGFEDHGKEAVGGKGSNRFGDLVFWKEILQHGRDVRANGVVIVSNDGKDDWHIGGEDKPKLDETLKPIRDGLPPLPRPHPMLRFEARGAAGVADLMIVNRAYLAIFLRRTGEPSNRFFNAAIDIPLPRPIDDDRDRRRDQKRQATGAVGADAGTKAGGSRTTKHPIVADGRGLSDGAIALKLALSASGKPDDPRAGPLIAEMLSAESEGKGLSDFLTSEALEPWDTRNVVWFGRALGTRSIQGDPLASVYVTDLLSTFESLPPLTATALYLGLLAAAYLDEETVRAVPQGSWLGQLFELQSSDRAAVAIPFIVDAFDKRGGCPVYLPDPARPVLLVKPLLHAVPGGQFRLVGLQIGDIGVLVEAQGEQERLLVSRFPGRTTVSIQEVVDEACSMLGIPANQIARTDELAREVAIGPTVGIAMPDELQNNMEDQS